MKTPQIIVQDVTVSFSRVPALHHVSLELEAGQCVAILGPNGAGKTTLLKTLAGLLKPETGTVRFENGWSARHEIAYLPQRESVDWDFPITVRGVVEMGCCQRLGWWRSFTKKEHKEVDAALHHMRLEALADRQISALSGGQQQRAFLARSLVQKARIFLLDEPFAGLDKPSQESLGAIIKDLALQGNLVVASHHDLKNVSDFFTHALFLNSRLTTFGPVGEALTESNIQRTFHAA
jgi:heme ABC exporter ATP-binding subunit CcmA